MKYTYIVINTEGYSSYSELQQTLNSKGKDGYHIVSTFGKSVIMEKEEK